MFRNLMSVLLAALCAAAGGAAHAADARPDVTVAVNALPVSLEPAVNTGNVSVRVNYSIFDTLIRRDFASGKLVPSLAVSWERSSPSALDVKLRRGVKFHDGSDFTADDVVFTFSPERLTGKNAAIPGGRAYFGHLKDVLKIDSHTVRFITNDADPVLDQRLASYSAWIVSERQWMKHKTNDPNWMRTALREIIWNPVGTGPLKFKDWRKDQYVAFTANDEYFGGKPTFRSVTFRAVPELATRIAGLASGEFDIIVDVTPDQLPVLGRYKDIETKSVVLENSQIILFNTNAPALKDKRLRQALSLAIDRKKLRDALWQGKNYTPNGYQLKAFGATYKADRPGYVFDLQKARRLVKEAGYTGQPISLRLINNYYLNGVESAQVLLEMWKAAGINVKLDFVENFTQVRAAGVEMHQWSNTYRLPDPSGAINILYGPESETQRSHKFWTAPPAFNQLANVVDRSVNPKERYAAFQKMLDIFEDEMPMTILYNPLYTYASKKRIQWTAYPLFYMDFRPDVFRASK